jgi:hypothetical protein
MKKLVVSFCNVYTIYEVISFNKVLSSRQFQDLLHIVIYTLLKEKIVCTEKRNIELALSLDNSAIVFNPDLLLKALYYLDATLSLDDLDNVPFQLKGVYKEQLLFILSCLLQEKCFTLKQFRVNTSFLEAVYLSVFTKLKTEKQDLLDGGYLLTYLQRLSKKDKSLVDKLYSVVGVTKITEVRFYTKYDHFDKEYCTKARFIVTQSTSTFYPVGSYVFGAIQSNRTSVLLYKDSQCVFQIENE